QPRVEPFADLREPHAHDDFPLVRNAVGPGVGSSPAWIVSVPSTTFDGYSNRPRSGGPEARAPSREYAPPWHGHMNRPDWGNQRTGQPRCAQLTAKTWNFSPSMRRTQQAVSTVLPSVGIT